LKESGCALVHGLEVQLDEDGLLDEAERIALLEDVLDWFFGEKPASCSLEVCCEALGLTVEKQRARATHLNGRRVRHSRNYRLRFSTGWRSS
jgi:hypothetical protein